MKVNFWLFFAMVGGAANIFLFHSRLPLQESYHTWPIGVRAALEFIPLFAALLWVRSMARWMRGMDELYRRVTLEAWLFAAAATLWVLSLWPLLDRSGVSTAVLRATNFHLEALDQPNLPLTLGILVVFYILGHSIFNRRYK